MTRSTSKLATNQGGKIRISPHVPIKPVKVDGMVNLRTRLKIHETVELHLMHKGMSYPQAHKRALEAERGSMTDKEWQRYNGILGQIARNKPWSFK